MSERTQFLRFFAGNFARFVLLPLVAIGLIAFVVWYFAFRDDTPSTPSQGSGISQVQEDSERQGSGNETDNSKDDEKKQNDEKKTSDSANQSQTNTAPTTPNSAQSPQQLAESGPSEVIALFVLTTLAGTTISYIYRLKKI